jgi:gluconokinase
LPFIDADDLHSEANKEKMSRGEPLTDADRAPWLVRVRRAAEEAVESNQNALGAMSGVVVACSALKASYRKLLRGERADLVADTYSQGGACGEEIITARNENSHTGHPVEEGGGLERQTDGEEMTVGESPLAARQAHRRAPPPRTVFVHPFGARAVLLERMMRRESHFMKANMLESQIGILENPGWTGEDGVVEIRIEGRVEEQVRAAVDGLHEVLPYM